jgi:hypothetical protein
LAVSNGLVYAGGAFTHIGGQNRLSIACIDSSSGVASNWKPDAHGEIAVVSVSGNVVYAGGIFDTIGGQKRNNIAALDVTSGLATSWDPNANSGCPNSYSGVLSIVPKDSLVYIGGFFTAVGGQNRNNIAALDVATGLATGWNPNASGSVNSVLLSDSTIYAGGYFSNIGGQTRKYIAAIDAATGLSTSWAPDADDAVYALAIGGGTVYAGGSFTIMGGHSRYRFAALSATTGQVTPCNPHPANTVYTLATTGNAVYVGGEFSGMDDNYSRRYFMALVDSSQEQLSVPTTKIANSSLYLFPNPSIGEATALIQTNQPRAAFSLRVTDILGRIQEQHQAGANTPLSFGASLTPGIYLVEATGMDGSHIARRWVKK